MISLALAAQLALLASGPDTAAVCQPFDVTVAARVAGAQPPRLVLPLPAGVQLLRTSIVVRTERDGAGLASTIVEATYVLAAASPGRVSFVAMDGGTHARAAPVVIDVRPSEETTPAVLVRAWLDSPDGRRSDTLFVGQQLDYVVDVQLNETARNRLRRNPTFFPPEMPSVLAYDLPPAPPSTRDGRQCFQTLSYRRALFPLFAGPVAIAPATLTYSLPLSTSFFSREESYELHTDSVHFVAVEPPPLDRPADYAGAVGAIQASTRVSATAARMGDPVVLTLHLDGVGNVKLLPRPALVVPWAATAAGDERVVVDSTATRVRGAKEFDWLVTPRRAGRMTIAPIRYPFFDPARAAYEVVLTDSIALDVAAAALASSDTAVAARLGIRRALRPEHAPPLPSRPWYWALLVAAPLPAALRRVRTRRRRRASTTSPQRRLRQLAAQRAVAPRELRRTWLDALRERVPAVGEWTSRVPLGRTLRRAGVTDATADAAEALLDELDAAAFSPRGRVESALAERAVDLASAVSREAVRPTPRSSGITPLGVAMLVSGLVAAQALLAAPTGVERAFADGVRAYERGDWTTARRLFAHTAARAPHSVDAWANLGTAAWAVGDSARAAQGWQRALRLDPLDQDARDRLVALQTSSVSAPAYVPPLPSDAPALVAVLLWTAAWLALALPARRRPAGTRPLAGGALALAVVGLLVALELQEHDQPRGLGAVRSSRALLEAPGGDATPTASVTAGEVGRLGAREGAWLRISVDDARAGWLPAAAVLPLDEDPGAD